MNIIRRKAALAIAAAAAVPAVMLLGVGSAQAGTVTYAGCAPQHVCVYTAANYNTIEENYISYGYYNQSNMLNTHRVLNNQTEQAWVHHCYNYGGTNCPASLAWSAGTAPACRLPA